MIILSEESTLSSYFLFIFTAITLKKELIKRVKKPHRYRPGTGFERNKEVSKIYIEGNFYFRNF
jgi:hypothetical protein